MVLPDPDVLLSSQITKIGKISKIGSATTTRLPARPLGRPASDLSVYSDKTLFFPPTTSKGVKRNGQSRRGVKRSVTTKPCLLYEDEGSWPRDVWQSRQSSNQRELCTPQIAAYTVGDQRSKVGIRGRPQTHDVASLPSFKTQQTTTQSSANQLPPRPHSEPLVCKLPRMTIVKDALFQRQNHGFPTAMRHSTYRSLASNPKLKIEATNGNVTISRRRRAKSLPPKLLGKHLKPQIEDNKNITGWHKRSRSPTFTTLAQTKEHLDAALSKKLWEIRCQIDGRKARQNSALSEMSSAKSHSDQNPEEWYERMLQEHSDEDLAAIETLSIANYDDELNAESIQLVTPRPRVDFRFDKQYIKTHINDWNLLSLMQLEERKRIERDTRRSKRDAKKPPTQSSKPNVETKKYIEIVPPKDKTSTETKKYIEIVSPNETRKHHTPVFSKPEPISTVPEEPVLTPRLIPKKENIEKEVDVPVKEMPSSETCISPALTNQDIASTKPTTNDLVTKYLSNRPSVSKQTIAEQVSESKEKNDMTKIPEQSEEKETEKKLTEKEKFLQMRKRMEDIKADKAKKREKGMGDYVRLGMNVKKGADNFLGNLMSSRLEKIMTFKSKEGCDNDEYESDDDDDDSDDDD